MDARRWEKKAESRLLKRVGSAASRDGFRRLVVLARLVCLVCLICLACLLLFQRTSIDALRQLDAATASPCSNSSAAQGRLQALLHTAATSFSTTHLGQMLSKYLSAGVLALSAAQPGSASLLYASSYGGSVTTLNLTPRGLDILSSTTDCSPDPAWLTLDRKNAVLYCLGEGLQTRNGSLAAFKTSPDGGPLELLHKVDTIRGPVSSVLFGAGSAGLAVAHYSGSSLSSFSVSDLGQLQSKTWSEPLGPNTTRQDAPHPHEATVDPSGKFVLVPDLGSDLVRVLRIDSSKLGLMELSPLVAAPGSGPRHLVFLCTRKKTFLYLVGELDNTVTVYQVTYQGQVGNEVLAFERVFVTGTFGERPVPQSTSAEIHLSPDNRFLLVSSRFDRSFNIPSFDDANKTIPSDSISNFAVNRETGALSLVQTFPAGGLTPRQFSINKAGDRLAVGLQADGRVTIIERDARRGTLKRFVASANLEAGVTAVLFDE